MSVPNLVVEQAMVMAVFVDYFWSDLEEMMKEVVG